ncbi:MAG: ADP-ribosylglycohydrolase family protein [Aristaeellaceae bacterium]
MRNEEYWSLWGPVEKYSPGTAAVMADRQIRRGMEDGSLLLDDSMGNGKAVVTCMSTGKWFMISGGWGNDNVCTAMMGAVCGDVAGSVYEWNNIKHRLDPDKLIAPNARFTDDTVMTCAVAEGIRTGLSQLPDDWMAAPEAEDVLEDAIRRCIQRYGRKYPTAGYGGQFRRWLASENPQPYNSWGNGSAMRASYAGWVARSLAEAEKLAEISARVTHNHPEGIKGAVAVAGCIFQLRNGGTKKDVAAYAERFYSLDFTMDGIREDYAFDVSCAGSVPQGIKAFLEGESFADILSLAISIGGDSDTIAAIAGSIAEVIYPIPQGLRGRVIDRMDAFLRSAIADAVDFMYRRLPA